MMRIFNLAGAAVLLASTVYGQTQVAQKIAIIDMQSALVATKDGQKAVAALRAKFGPKDQELQKRQQDLQAKQEQYRKTQNTMSEDARQKLELDIDTFGKALQRDSDDAKQDMDADQQRILQDLGGKIMQVITKYAQENQYSIVFDVSGQPNNILFASNAMDVTRDVIAIYDKSSAPAAAPVTSAAPATRAPAATGTPAGAAKPAAPPAPK